jgi:hypothetical protein
VKVCYTFDLEAIRQIRLEGIVSPDTMHKEAITVCAKVADPIFEGGAPEAFLIGATFSRRPLWVSFHSTIGRSPIRRPS